MHGQLYVCRFELDARQGSSQGDEEEEIWAEELLPRTSKSPHTSSPQPSKHYSKLSFNFSLHCTVMEEKRIGSWK